MLLSCWVFDSGGGGGGGMKQEPELVPGST